MLKRKHFGSLTPLLGLMLSLFSTGASAHVKWFCAFDVAGQPRGLENVLCTDFEFLSGIAILILTLGYFFEAMPIGGAVLRSLDRVTSGLRENSDLILRAGLGFFFVALWTMGGIILTPELKTVSPLIPWLQLCFAACLLWPQTLVLSAAGIVSLFGLALYEYGLFHLMDYPVFLGFAAYLALTGLKRELFGLRPLDVLRWSAAITLMWASIEKWAYPEWTFGLFVTNPSLLMGFDEEFYMRAAGVVEFALSFALVLTPLMQRTSALILLGAFVSAISSFGKIDAIGHAPIIVAMIAIIADNRGLPQRVRGTKVFADGALWKGLGLVPAGFVAALSIFLASYYVMHSVLFHTSIL
jgi:hypothetical protein